MFDTVLYVMTILPGLDNTIMIIRVITTTGSLCSTFVPDRPVCLSVKLPYAIALYARLPSVLREPLVEQWTTHGRVKIGMEDVTFQYTGESSKFLTVWQHRGSVTFHAKNFKPSGELSLFSNTYLPAPESRVYDAKKLKINYGSLPSFGEFRLKDAFTRKVLENLPYARRGYIFKNKELKAFYEKQPWYMPDPDYKEASLTEEEKTWLKEVRALKVAN